MPLLDRRLTTFVPENVKDLVVADARKEECSEAEILRRIIEHYYVGSH